MFDTLNDAIVHLKKTVETLRIEKKTNSLEEMLSSINTDKADAWYVSDYSINKNDDGSFGVRICMNKENAQPKEFQGRYEYKSYSASSIGLQPALDLIKQIGA